jgi:hypothetical protein
LIGGGGSNSNIALLVQGRSRLKLVVEIKRIYTHIYITHRLLSRKKETEEEKLISPSFLARIQVHINAFLKIYYTLIPIKTNSVPLIAGKSKFFSGLVILK